MKLSTVFVRFYKSFNFDFIRRVKSISEEENIQPMQWEFIGDKFFPHVRIPIDSQITTVVGANESGKSHLLSAIEKGIYGDSGKFSIEEEDFCRYSHFFESVEDDVPRYPDFGFEWTDLTEQEQSYLKQICPTSDGETELNYKHFYFFRTKAETVFYIPELKSNKNNSVSKSKIKKTLASEGKTSLEDEKQIVKVNSESAENNAETSENKIRDGNRRFVIEDFKEEFLPPVFTIDSKIALPDSVEIRELLKGRKTEGEDYEVFNRAKIHLLAESRESIDNLLDIISRVQAVDNLGSINSNTIERAKDLQAKLSNNEEKLSKNQQLEAVKAFNLVYDLMFEIAKISKNDFKNLDKGLKASKTGNVKALTNKINTALKDKLRFPRIWSQDKNFALRVEATEHEINFIINDRTECEYSFDERSGGLKHFLSYYIQYLTHKTPEFANSEILLMDEPDAYLSGEAQQDLLKIFQMFASPSSPGRVQGQKPVQVTYVTHSPFLIDKNHSERVRALEKPAGKYGTQVVPGVTQNRYEPLRSAFGAFLGETTFMSQCNLMVEGPADQILIAGANNYLRNVVPNTPDSDVLDLNKITIVPCGGTTNVPYMVYLAKGRGVDKPAIIVLLDSDKAGNKAKDDLGKRGPHPDDKAVLESEFIFQLGDITNEQINFNPNEANKNEKPFIDLEDLVPLSLSMRVVNSFLSSFFDLSDEVIQKHINKEEVIKIKEDGKSYYSALKKLVNQIDSPDKYDIDKVPFAKTLIEMLPELTSKSSTDTILANELNEFAANMRSLLKILKVKQIRAEDVAKEKNQRKKVQEKVDIFLSDYESSGEVQRNIVSQLLGNIESDLEGSQKEKAFIIGVIGEIRQSQRLADDPIEKVPNFEKLIGDLNKLKEAKLQISYLQSSMPKSRKEL